MMEFMRTMAAGWVAKIFMGLLVLSFAVWGIADIFNGFGRGAVATVGDAEIDARDYQVELNKELRQLSNRLGQTITASQSAAFGLPNQVLGRMIAEGTLDDLALKYNVGLSDQELAKRISQEPSFQSLGSFDRSYMQQVLRSIGTTEDRYVSNRAKFEARRQIASGLAGEATAPIAALKVFHRFANEERAADYLVLEESALPELAEPTDSDLKTYYDANKLAFRALEYRSFDLLKLEPGDVADIASVSDEDAKISYETAASRFIQAEKRQVQQILFNSKDEADAAAAKIKDGATFEEILAERNITEADADFGLLTKAEVSDPAAADVAFGLELNTVSDVVDGRFGKLLLRVTKIEPEASKPFDEVKDLLKAEIAADRANGEVLDIFDNIEDERAGGATLQEIADKFNLKLRKVEMISKAGELKSEEKVTDLPEQEKLLTSVFDSDVDLETDAIDVANAGFAWFNVTNITPAQERPLDEVKDKVIAAWKEEKRSTQLADFAAKLKDELAGGKSLEAIATEQNMSVQQATNITRQSPGDLPQSAVDQVFGGPVGYASTAADGNKQYVLQVKTITAPEFNADGLENDALRQQLNQNAESDLLSQVVAGLQRDLGITINQPLLNQLAR
ncbi:MAG: SurA N-terminal domain-containing protein [Cohaesibacter sp.]|jgi:peptidyl-prolyl cis-trans isomerase D|nr:SurA N-terminal domain-containing protein [Cohaesibacter sp.]